MSSSDTLLDTPLTWQDVESEIQKTLDTTAKFGEKKKAVNLGHMKGFMSRIALIDADWLEVPEDVQLPQKLVLKISSTLGLDDLSKITSTSEDDESESDDEDEEDEEERKRMEEMVKMSHNLEVHMYQIIGRENNPNLPTTRVYASRAFTKENDSKGFLVSEFIQNVHPVPVYENIPYEDLVPVIDATAAFSAMGQRMSEEEKKATIGTTSLEDEIRDFFGEHNSEKTRSNLLKVLGDSFREKIDIAMETIDLICGNAEVLHKYSSISDTLGHEPVLMHSDLWAANMIFTKNDDGRLNFRALIDFQTASFSSPGLDVAMMAVSCLSSEDRHKYQDEYLHRYYEKFVSNLEGAPVPYTFEQLRDSYELYFPGAVVIILSFVWSYAKYVGNEAALESARQKTAGIIEDLIEVQESNKKKFPTFFNL